MKTALIAGASGLVGSELLSLLVESNEYQTIHVVARRPGEVKHPKIVEHIIDFSQLDTIQVGERIDDAFCALGTTIKKAGSRELFERVDFKYIVDFALKSRMLGAKHFLLVSAMGADSSSKIFYNRVKGKTEEIVKRMEFEHLSVFRPSLLLGKRVEKRSAEKSAEWIMTTFDFMVPAKYKAIKAETVAVKMYRVASAGGKGTTMFESDQIRNI
mgnify:CR=1 FL=1